jgi:5,6-dimethylbenzimidazole synthase
MMKYDDFLELLKYRRSIRKFKTDPIPDEYIDKILDAAHYSMSGSNMQPWEFLVVKNPETKKELVKAYAEYEFEKRWYSDQMRAPKFRHPGNQVKPEEEDEAKEKARDMSTGWRDAPVFLIVLRDPRKQYGSTACAFEDLNVNILVSGMGHISMVIQLVVASLGLGSARADVSVQEPYRTILGYPEPLKLDQLVPIGYRAYEPGPPLRFDFKDMVHYEKYDMNKYMTNKGLLKYQENQRLLSIPGYRHAIKTKKEKSP